MEKLLIYMIDHFPDLLDVNFTASIVILFVICVRFLLKKAPKTFSYVLWAIVLLRLLVPISIESPMSFVPQRTEFSSTVDLNEVMPELEFEFPSDREFNQVVLENTVSGEPFVQTGRSLDAQTYLTFGWMAGMVFMLLRSIISYCKLRSKLKVVVPFRKGIYIADDIDTPFVMGFFRPIIYLPGTLDPAERKYIIAHERHHIRRGDHVFKILGYLALTIHWFNPLVWVAYTLASRDMEMSCDEAVIRKYGENIRADYSASLLNLAAGHRLFTGNPLAFGETDPAGRVRNLAKWKKPAIRVVVFCVMICAILAVCLLTNPEEEFDWSTTRVYGPTSCTLEDFQYTTPEGLAVQTTKIKHSGNAADYGNEFYLDDTLVGGLILRYQDSGTGLEPFSPEWAVAMGIPEALDTNMGYFSGSSAYADYEMTYFPDIPVNYDENFEMILDENGKYVIENEVTHYFFIYEDNVYDLWFYNNRLSVNMQAALLKSVTVGAPTEISGWGVSIKADRVSRTGATALFDYSGSIPGEDGAELTYGDFYCLDRWVDGAWIPCEELAGYDYFVGDSSYPVTNGYGIVHEWQDRFGELVDGHYRLGKQVTLIRADGSQENRIVYGEFAIPDSVLSGPIPLEELPQQYGAEQAIIDGCVVSRDGVGIENMDAFRAFYESCYQGNPGFIRVITYSYGEDPHYIVKDIQFDNHTYMLSVMESRDRWVRSMEFRHLKYFSGEVTSEELPYDAFECYVLVYDNNITWNEISDGQHTSQHHILLENFIYNPNKVTLPSSPSEASLMFEGTQLVHITDFDRLEKIWILFEEAEFMGYEPKTHNIGIGLELILTNQNGDALTIELDPESDICRINGEYVFYGAFDEPDYIEKLWYYLGITQWPDEVYEKYPDALKPQ